MRKLHTFGILTLLAGGLQAQHVISARSGLVHYAEGKVTVAGVAVPEKSFVGDFPEIKEGQELRTELGRAEVLLSPGVFLRVAEKSAVRMVSNKLENTRLELLAGTALLEVGDLERDQELAVQIGATGVEFPKRGLYRLDFDPARIRVFDGSAVALNGGQTVTIREGRQAVLAGVITPEKFGKDTDAFHRWAARRSGYISMANLTAAKRVRDNDTPWRASSWVYNPYFGSFTYLPFRGTYQNPFGFAYYSPYSIEQVYYRPPVYAVGPSAMPSAGMDAGMRSYSDYGGRSSMGSYSAGGSASAPPAPAAAAPAASGGRSGDSGGGRSTSGGR